MKTKIETPKLHGSQKYFCNSDPVNSLEPLKLQSWHIKYDEGLEETKHTKNFFNNF